VNVFATRKQAACDRPRATLVVFRSLPPARRIALSAAVAMVCGLGVVSLATGSAGPWGLRLVEGIAVFGLGVVIVGGAAVLVMIRLAGWKDPESEREFDALVERAEWLAELGHPDPEWLADPGHGVAEPEREGPRSGSAPGDEHGFDALVRSAIDQLPLEFHRALEHVAVVVSDGGERQQAYGLYQGDTIAQDHFHERIVIFRDTLLRDFGHDRALLKAQVTRVLRHELAHHLGWDERGVRGLGL
jgi:predicted Zn-dependent protease with MMP-like domain